MGIYITTAVKHSIAFVLKQAFLEFFYIKYLSGIFKTIENIQRQQRSFALVT